MEIYYLNQDDWTQDDYYSLNRYFSRIMNYPEKWSELDSIDLSKLSEISKVLLYINIVESNHNHFLEKENLRELENVEPLKERLELTDEPTCIYETYEKFNVGW